jgi:hypothetical protein
VNTIAGALALIPNFEIGISGFGASPRASMQLGGPAISTSVKIGADILNLLSSVASYEASSIFVCHQVCLFLGKTLHPWGKMRSAVAVNQRRAHRTLALYLKEGLF